MREIERETETERRRDIEKGGTGECMQVRTSESERRDREKGVVRKFMRVRTSESKREGGGGG